MCKTIFQRRRTWLLSAALLAGLWFLLGSPNVFAKLSANTIHPVGLIAENGRGLLITGPISFTAGEMVHMKVTVTQRSTGALAEGTVVLHSTGTPFVWQVELHTCGQAVFKPGPATAVAVAVSATRHQATDAHQWLVNITLTQ